MDTVITNICTFSDFFPWLYLKYVWVAELSCDTHDSKSKSLQKYF